MNSREFKELRRPDRVRDIPDSVLVDRERRYAAEQRLEHVLFGDPLPGYSALDRKREGK
jgi:hypothetical protein